MPRPLQFRSSRLWTLLGFLLLLVVVGIPYLIWFTVALSPLEQVYLSPYMNSAMLSGRPVTVPFRAVLLTGPKGRLRPAVTGDVAGLSPFKSLAMPVTLSAQARAAGWAGLRWDALREYQAADLEVLLRERFYGGKGVARIFLPLEIGVILLMLAVAGVWHRFGSHGAHEERHGRRTKGPELTSPGRFIRTTKADGICLQLASGTNPLARTFRIPRKLEPSHILLMGDTGSGKSNAIRQILRQVEERGETAVVYDPACEFAEMFYKPDRGDLILNPLDERCPYWSLESELQDYGTPDAIAAAMIPHKEGEKAFFIDVPRRVLARMLTQGTTVESLLRAWPTPTRLSGSSPAHPRRRMSIGRPGRSASVCCPA